MLRIKNLQATIDNKTILTGLNLNVNAGEVHAIMGPNGAGKSTLASVIAGQDNFEVTGGSIDFMGKDILDMESDERACNGIFLAFQYPVEIPGVTTTTFLRTAVNKIREYNKMKPVDSVEFLAMMKEKMELVEIKKELLHRDLNSGFSGGEKKRNEIFQMAMLNPKLSILDETDSGLDIDALKVVAKGVNTLKNKNNATIVITHYQRLLDYIIPDFVHILLEGKIVKTGDSKLALKLEKEGYDWLYKEIETKKI